MNLNFQTTSISTVYSSTIFFSFTGNTTLTYIILSLYFAQIFLGGLMRVYFGFLMLISIFLALSSEGKTSSSRGPGYFNIVSKEHDFEMDLLVYSSNDLIIGTVEAYIRDFKGSCTGAYFYDSKKENLIVKFINCRDYSFELEIDKEQCNALIWDGPITTILKIKKLNLTPMLVEISFREDRSFGEAL